MHYAAGDRCTVPSSFLSSLGSSASVSAYDSVWCYVSWCVVSSVIGPAVSLP